MNGGAIYVSLGLDTKAFSAGIAGATAKMKTMGMSMQKMGKGMSMYLTAKTKTMGMSMQKMGKGMSMYLTAPLALIGGLSYKVFKDWETSLSKITGLVGIAQEQVDGWKQGIMDLAAETGIAATELADAMFFITSAGLRGADAMDALEYSAKAAAAGLGETEVIADLLTSAMNAYGSDVLSAAQATDILTATVREGKASAEDISGAMGNVLPIASAMGVSFEEVGGAIAAMTRTGTEARVASTQLKAIMSSLINPTEEGRKALAELGLTYEGLRNQLDTEGLDSLLLTLKDINDEKGIEFLGSIVPNIRAMSGVLDLVGSNAEDNMKIFEAMTDTTGSLDAAFLDASMTAEFRTNQALAKLKNTAIQLGEGVKNALVPVLERLGNIAAAIGDKFAGMTDSGKRLTIAIAAMATAACPLLMVFGSILTKAPALAGAFMKVGKAVKAAAAAMNANPYLALAAVIVVIIGLIATWGKSQEDLMKEWDAIKKAWADVGFVKKAFAEYKKVWDDLSATFKEVAQMFGKAGESVDLFTFIFKVMVKGFKVSITPLRTVVAIIRAIVTLFGYFIQVIKKVASIVRTALEPIITRIQSFIGKIKQFVGKVIESVSGFIQSIMPYLRKFIDFLSKMVSPFKKVFNTILDAVKNILKPLKKAFRKVLEVIIAAVDPIIETLDELGVLPAGLRNLRDNILGAKKDIEDVDIEVEVSVIGTLDNILGDLGVDSEDLGMDDLNLNIDTEGIEDGTEQIINSLTLLEAAQKSYGDITKKSTDAVKTSMMDRFKTEVDLFAQMNKALDKNVTDRFAVLEKDTKNTRNWTDVMKELSQSMASTLESSLESMIASTIETAAAGEGWRAVWMGLLGGVADLLVQLGKLAIASGIAVKGIQEALKGNPGLAVIGGIALVALGAGIKAGLSSLAEQSEGGGIQGLATGGIVKRGGVFKVGEQGEEMVTLPTGAAVTPNHALNPLGNLQLSTRFKGRDLEILLERATAQSKRR